MKNIHLIPTDKPSKLLLSGFGTLFLTPPMRFKNSDTYQHMYITSDEEIKKGDWYINPRINKVLKCDHTNISVVNLFECKKIILSTDQNLIANGVQAIDDEFLEWFVKNPSCEKVEVESGLFFYAEGEDRRYKIIIPKEEPDYTALLQPVGKRQETLEEAAERYVEEYKWEEEQDPWFDFMEGAKWQQERMYNEEEVFRIIASLLHTPKLVEESSWEDITEWFKQFKKK